MSNFINEQIIRSLPESKFSAFEDVMDRGGDTNAFLSAHIPNFQEVLGSILADFRKEYSC